MNTEVRTHSEASFFITSEKKQYNIELERNNKSRHTTTKKTFKLNYIGKCAEFIKRKRKTCRASKVKMKLVLVWLVIFATKYSNINYTK